MTINLRTVRDSRIRCAGDQDLLIKLADHDGCSRYTAWMEAVHSGALSSDPADAGYDRAGSKAWKTRALRTAEDRETYTYRPGSPYRRWKLFHDDLQEPRLGVLHVILPKCGICAG